ncbi:MAG: WecB/TagA/CpsF family glycosyltransferase [Thermotogaceae bacterium]|nr:WecB/TagA/CpsF family glycosyltransferase [Thermotogaceae bacterium]
MELFEIEILELPKDEILDALINRIDNEKRTFVVTANALIMLRVAKDPEYRRAIKESDFVVPDGFGIHLVGKLKHKRDIPRYPGVDIMRDLLEIGKKRKWKFYFLGAKEEVVERLWKIYKDQVNVVGYHHGYFGGEGPVSEIVSLKPDVVFVAMGAPKQEFWIWRNLEKFEKGLFMGVGGSFDVLSGVKRRAPDWVIKMGFEWAYRFFQSPSKRWKVPFQIGEFLIRALLYREEKAGNEEG